METSGTFELLLALAIVIVAAKVSGAFARLLNQPRVFGSLLAGLVIGTSFLNVFESPLFSPGNHEFLMEIIHVFAELGVLFLMFNIGLDVHLSELVEVGKSAVSGGILGALTPMLFTIPVVLLFSYPLDAALFAGVTLAATAVSISAQTLLDMGLLKTKEGNTFLATTLVDDILAILLLSIVSATVGRQAVGEQTSILMIVVRMSLYISGAFVLAWLIVPRIINWVETRDRTRQLVAPTAIVLALLFGWSAETLGGLASITGAFIAGVGISRALDTAREEIYNTTNRISYAFLSPIFFVSIGLQVNLREFPVEALALAGVLMAVAILSKIVGCGLGTRLGGLSNIEALRVGVCMISRGEVGLIIVSIGLAQGVFDNALFSSLFLVVLLTTVLTPPLVRLVFRGSPSLQS